jgi:peptidyl-prolyl cis-trans isomerase C
MQEMRISARHLIFTVRDFRSTFRMKRSSSPFRAIVVASSLAIAASTQAQDAPAAKAETPSTPATKESAAPAVELKDPVAVVNGKNISKADLEKAFSEAVASAGIDPSMLSEDQKLAGYRQLVDDMIIDQLITAQATGVEVSDADVKAEIEKIKGQFPSPEAFAEQLKQSGQTEEKLTDLVKNGLKQRRWIESQIKGKDAVADADAKKFYDENTTEFEQPEQVEASHILFLVPEDASPEVVKQKEDAANAALKRAKAGEDFNALAKELSEEPNAKESGGNLGFFAKDRMVPAFADAAFSQDKGAITGPVRTEFGFHVIKVTDKKAAGTLGFDEVKDQINSYLQNNKRREAVQSVVDNLRKEAKVQVNLPEPPAAASPSNAPAAPIGN